jgi:hypothetical protein
MAVWDNSKRDDLGLIWAASLPKSKPKILIPNAPDPEYDE